MAEPESDLPWAEEETEEIEAFEEPIPIEAFEARLAEEAMLEPEVGPELEPEPPIVAPTVEAPAQVVRAKGKRKKVIRRGGKRYYRAGKSGLVRLKGGKKPPRRRR